jgi:hypothetical protein
MTTRLALAFALLAVAATGCGAGDGNAVDAGPDIDVDPGSADAGAPDAVPVDAEPTAPDAAPDATPAPTAARVTVLTLARDGLPQIGAVVVFAGPGDSPTTHRVTGADGTASAPISSGASVTVVWATPGGARLLTITDLEPGDDLMVGEPRSVTPPTGFRDVVLSFVPYENRAMYAFTRCSPSGQSVSANQMSALMRFQARCDAAGANDDFVLRAQVGTTNYASYLFDVPQAASQELPGFTVVDDMAMTLANLPDDIGRIGTQRSLRRGGQPFLNQGGVLLDAPVGAATMYIDLGTLVAGDDMVMTTSIKRASQLRHTMGVREVLAPSASYGFDAAETLLPWFQPGVFDPATRRLAWSLSADKPFDLLWIDAVYTRGSGSEERSFRWRIVTASSTGSFELPALPIELVGDVLPAAGDVAWLGEGRIVEVSNRTYRDLVQHIDLEPYLRAEADPIGTRLVDSAFGCGSRACPGI